MIKVTVERTDLTTRNKKDGSGTYQLQTAWAHLVRDGRVEDHPTRIEVFPPRNDAGMVVPYQPGDYSIDDESYRVSYGRIEIGFLRLKPVAQKMKAAS